MAPTKTIRTKTRSSSTEPYSVQSHNEIINDQFRRARNPSTPEEGEGRPTLTGDMAGPSRSASEPGGTPEELPLNTPFGIGSDGSDGNVNRVALVVWDQLLTTNNMTAIIGHNSFTRGLQRLFSIQQQEEIMKLIRSNMIA